MARTENLSFVVEFVGLPGAGKSTLSHAVAESLRARGERITEPTHELTVGGVRRARKATYAALTLLRHPWASLVAIRQIIMSRQRTLRDFGVSAFNFLYMCGLIARINREPGIHLLDQGYFNALWSIGFGAGTLAPLAPLTRVGFHCCDRDLIDLVLLIEVKPETVLARLSARPGTESRLEGRGGSARFGAGLDTALRSLEQIRASLEALAMSGRGCARFETIGNDAPQSWEQAEFVAAVVLGALRSSGPVAARYSSTR